jgi:hypothetical protein
MNRYEGLNCITGTTLVVRDSMHFVSFVSVFVPVNPVILVGSSLSSVTHLIGTRSLSTNSGIPIFRTPSNAPYLSSLTMNDAFLLSIRMEMIPNNIIKLKEVFKSDKTVTHLLLLDLPPRHILQL